MTAREAFEAKMLKLNYCTRLARQSAAVGGEYRTVTVERAWQLWQAADKAATERVVAEIWQMLDGMIVRGPLQGNGWDETAQRNGVILAANAVAAIRALKGKP